MTHRSLRGAYLVAAILTVLAAPAFAQTQPPAATVTVCRADAAGVLVPFTIHADQAQPGDTVTVTGSCLQPTPTAPLSVEGVRATPVPAVAVVATATTQPAAEPTGVPTWTPEPTVTPERVAEPTMPTGPMPDCSPDQPQGTACEGK